MWRKEATIFSFFGLLAKHLSVLTRMGVTLSYSLAASHDVGHVEDRVTRRQDMFPDMVFDSSIRDRLFSGSYVLLPQWSFYSRLFDPSTEEKGQRAVLYPGNRMGRFN